MKQPHVHFEVSPLAARIFDIATSNVIANFDVSLLITPAKKYTPYEMFLLPFDFMTWIFVLTTFLVTFVSISSLTVSQNQHRASFMDIILTRHSGMSSASFLASHRLDYQTGTSRGSFWWFLFIFAWFFGHVFKVNSLSLWQVSRGRPHQKQSRILLKGTIRLLVFSVAYIYSTTELRNGKFKT